LLTQKNPENIFCVREIFRNFFSGKIHARTSNFLNEENQNPAFNPIEFDGFGKTKRKYFF